MPEAYAFPAGRLRHSDDREPGLARKSTARGFEYRDAKGRRVKDAETIARVKKLATAKFGDRTEKGLRWYAAMRTVQMRFMRLPKPQVKRGQYPA